MGIGSSIVTRAGPTVQLVSATSGAAQKVYNFEVEDYHTYFVGQGEVWVHNANCGQTLNQERTFTRGDKTYKIDQGDTANGEDGWEHIWRRHIDDTQYLDRTKFDTRLSQDDILGGLAHTVKHGEKGDYYGQTMFLSRMNLNGTGYRYYRATFLPDGRLKSFHPMEKDYARTTDWKSYNPW